MSCVRQMIIMAVMIIVDLMQILMKLKRVEF